MEWLLYFIQRGCYHIISSSAAKGFGLHHLPVWKDLKACMYPWRPMCYLNFRLILHFCAAFSYHLRLFKNPPGILPIFASDQVLLQGQQWLYIQNMQRARLEPVQFHILPTSGLNPRSGLCWASTLSLDCIPNRPVLSMLLFPHRTEIDLEWDLSKWALLSLGHQRGGLFSLLKRID